MIFKLHIQIIALNSSDFNRFLQFLNKSNRVIQKRDQLKRTQIHIYFCNDSFTKIAMQNDEDDKMISAHRKDEQVEDDDSDIEEIDDPCEDFGDDFDHFHIDYPSFINLQHYSDQSDDKKIPLFVRPPYKITEQILEDLFEEHRDDEVQYYKRKKVKRRLQQKKTAPFKTLVNMKQLLMMRDIFAQYAKGAIRISFHNMALKIGLGERTVFRYWKQYKNDPTLVKKINQIKKNKNTSVIRRGQDQSTIQRRNAVIALLNKHRKWNLTEIADQLNRNSQNINSIGGRQFPVRQGCLSRIMRLQGYQRLRIKKKLKAINNPQAVIQRQQFCETFLKYDERAIPVYYFFAKSVDIYFKRLFGWYKKNEDYLAKETAIPFETQGLLLTAFGGLKYPILWDIKLQKLKKQQFVIHFLKYLNNIRSQELVHPKLLICQRNDILLNDEIVDLLGRMNFKLLFLPLKDYNLNPLEIWYLKMKENIKEIQFKKLKDVKQAFQMVDVSLIDDDFKRYYRLCYRYISDYLNKQTVRNLD